MKTLTRDTLACLSQTVNGLVELSEYLLRKELFEYVFLGTRYSWEKTNNFNPKITAKQLVINILRTFRPSTGAIFNANNVPQTGWLATTPY